MNKKFSVLTKNKITKFNKSIFVENDKSISHRALLIASQCIGISYLTNILDSEDGRNTINCLKKLGVKILKKKEIILSTEMDWGLLENQKKTFFTLVIRELWLDYCLD